jgi:hypothetical protein
MELKSAKTKISAQIPTPIIFHSCDLRFGCDGILHLANIPLVRGDGGRSPS